MNNWIDKHSVNCYFCSGLVDERECMPADEYNDNDGGSICPDCLAKLYNDHYDELCPKCDTVGISGVVDDIKSFICPKCHSTWLPKTNKE